MIRWRWGTVRRVVRSWLGAVELEVSLVARAPDDPDTVRALAYPALVGTPEVGERALLNCNALALGLGTGGYAMVVALPDHLPPDRDAPGHVVKARYTPQQAIVQAVDEESSPHRDLMANAGLPDGPGLDGMPVVTADLHSALPAILAGILADRPLARVAYVMTDGGALPAWFSRSLGALADTLAGVVTCGQALGGDLEATGVHTGLLAARLALRAEIAIVAQGPGNLGTGTPWGFSGTAVGEAVNAASVLGGRPIGSLRISDADPRQRHRGISHHSLTAYGRVALASAELALPASGLSPDLAAAVERGLESLRARHRVVRVPVQGLDEALRGSPVRLSSMGRGLDAEYGYFLAGAAAGRHAVSVLPAASQPRQ